MEDRWKERERKKAAQLDAKWAIEKRTFIVEKPGRPHLNQMVKVTSPVMGQTDTLYQLLGCCEKNKHCFWGIPAKDE